MMRVSLLLFAWLLQSPLFEAAPPVAVGPGSGQILLVDLNGDGRGDMITRHLLQRRIGVWIGDGRGGFTASPGTPIALDYQPGGIATADVNGDGRADLVAAKSERDEVDIFLGDGKGGFTRGAGSPFAASASTDFYTRSVDLVDVNEDRRVDIIVANGRDRSFAILLGDGRGGFAPTAAIKRPAREDQRYTFAFGDIDGDGHVDALSAGRGGDDVVEPRIAVLRGDGRGGFRDGDAIAVSAGVPFMTLADVNGDRRLDLLIAHSHDASLSVLLNGGNGVFAAAAGSPLAVGAEAFGVVVADANNDGHADLIAGAAESVSVWLGDGRGRFAPAPGSPFRAGPGAYRVTVADVNGDGKLDVAAPSFDGNAVTVLLGR